MNEIVPDHQPQHLRFSWLTDRDRIQAPSAEIIRLIVDDSWRGHTANDLCQQNLFREVIGFIDSINENKTERGEQETRIVQRKVIASPAGLLTTAVDKIAESSLLVLQECLGTLQPVFDKLDLGCSGHEMLVGADGCIRGKNRPLQTVVHVVGRTKVSFSNTTVKVYPRDKEQASLLGWLIIKDLDQFEAIPQDLCLARRVETAVGQVLVLVCHEGIVFSKLSGLNPNQTRSRKFVKAFLKLQACAEPTPKYVLVATHWQGPSEKGDSGTSFINAAKNLAKETKATVITTMFAPREPRGYHAGRFPVIGENRARVSTLLVEYIG